MVLMSHWMQESFHMVYTNTVLQRQMVHICFHYWMLWLSGYHLCFCIQVVPGSNLGLETGCPDWGFSWSCLVSTGKCWNNTLNYAMAASLHILFPIHYSLIILSFDTTVKPQYSTPLYTATLALHPRKSQNRNSLCNFKGNTLVKCHLH
jgi:hypothetical protein